VQADSIVPDGVQGYDRYVYANNNPILFIDPSGHVSCSGSNWDDGPQCKDKAEYQIKANDELKRTLRDRFSWNMRGSWSIGQLSVAFQAGVGISRTVGGDYYLRRLSGSVDFDLKDMGYGGLGDAHHVTLNSGGFSKWTVAHELGHSLDGDYGWDLSRGLEDFTGGYTVGDVAGSNCANSANPGCNAAGYFYGGVPPKGSDWAFNRQEDFAESFAALVSPNQARQDILGNPAFQANQALQYDNYLTTTRGMYMGALVYLFTR
jgi:hypothetical protein